MPGGCSPPAAAGPVFRRALYAVAAPLIPLVRLERAVRDLLRPGRPRRLLPRLFLPLAAGLAVDGLGEMVGSRSAILGYRFSVVVPTHSRPRSLARCLEALSRQDYSRGSFEVILVDDGSAEPPRDALRGVGDTLHVRFILRHPNAGPAAARNAGAELARGDFLAFTDDDCLPTSGWLSALDRRLRESPEAMVGGRTLNALPDNPFSAVSQLVVDVVCAHYNEDPERVRFFASNNMAMLAGAFRRIGGFDAAFRTSEDRDLCDRWRASGGRMVCALDAAAEHAHPLTLAGFCGQHFAYGRGAWRFHRARARRKSGSLWSEMRFHARLPALLAERGGLSAGTAALLAVWQAANVSLPRVVQTGSMRRTRSD
jgi:GT2 family glycosyltransferase